MRNADRKHWVTNVGKLEIVDCSNNYFDEFICNSQRTKKKCNISEYFNLFREKCFALCLNWKTLEKVCAHCKCQVERGIQCYREKWGPKKRQNMPRKTEPLLFPNRLFLDEGPSFWFFENRKKK